MEYTQEKLSGNKVKITFTVPADEFEEAVQKAYLKARNQIMLPGWRKGKAPRKMIEKAYGAAVFYEDALEEIYPDALVKAVEEFDLKVVGRPMLDVVSMEVGQPVVYSAELFVMPEVKLGAYKDVEVKRTVHTVTEQEVNDRLEHERKENARVVEVLDRPLENGDEAELDYSGSVDDVKFDGGTAEHQKLVIGSHSFIPGFEEQMIGMNIGEERSLNVTFPEDYHAEELKGKNAVFEVKLHAITREELPELDDEFAADVSDFDTLADYRADIEKHMTEEAGRRADENAKNEALDKVVSAAEIDIPAPMIEDKLDEMMEEMSWRMQQQGFSMEQYLKILNQTPAQMRDMYRSEAERRVRSELVVDEIIKVEEIKADDAEVDKELEEYASAMNMTLEQVKERFNDEQIGYFRHNCCARKVLDLVWNNAKVEDVPEAEANAEEAGAEEAAETENA